MQTVVVLEGDQTGQELLEEALRVLAADVIGVELAFPRVDLSLEHRRAPSNGVVYEAAAAIHAHGFGLKPATVTPETAGRRGLAEQDPPRGDRRQGHRANGASHSRGRAAWRRPCADLGRPHGRRRRLRRDGVARRRRRRRGSVPNGAHRAAHLPRGRRVRVPTGRAHNAPL